MVWGIYTPLDIGNKSLILNCDYASLAHSNDLKAFNTIQLLSELSLHHDHAV